MNQLLLKGGRILCPQSKRDETGDLLIQDDKIAELGGEIQAGEARVLDCRGLVVAPGLIDTHVHLREPGHEYKENIASGSAAAAAGGYTALFSMPNTTPVNDTAAVTQMIIKKAREAGLARVHPVAAITMGLEGKALTEMADLKEAGCVAVSDDGRPVPNSQIFRRALEYADTFDLPVICHNESLPLSRGGVMNEGPTSTRLGLKGIPSESEVTSVERDLSLARLTGARMHIAHVSCAGSIEAVRRAKESGVRVTCETAPHYLDLTDHAVGQYDTNTKINPPLRSAEDREAVRKALSEGVIDMVATDHAPHTVIEKDVEFDLAAFGAIGMETALGVMLKLVNEGVFSLEQVIQRMSTAPARAFGLEGGVLTRGGPAQVVVIDPALAWTVEPAKFKSISRNCPWAGQTLPGRAVLTVLDGRITHELKGDRP